MGRCSFWFLLGLLHTLLDAQEVPPQPVVIEANHPQPPPQSIQHHPSDDASNVTPPSQPHDVLHEEGGVAAANSNQHPTPSQQVRSPTCVRYAVSHKANPPPHPDFVVDPALNGPVPEMELPDDEYKRLHEHAHLFDEVHAGHHHYGSEWRDDHEPSSSSDDEIVDEWSEHMSDFIPDMLVTFRLPAHSDEYFYQAVGPVPTLIRGGYFVAGENNTGTVHFSVIDPDGEVAMRRTRTEGLFHMTTAKAGTYTFIVANPQWMGDKFVTFVIGAGNETTLSVEHVNSLSDNVMVVARMIRDIQAESQYLWSRQKVQMASVRAAHSRIVWLSLVELVFCIGVVCFQVHFLKKLVSNKRIF